MNDPTEFDINMKIRKGLYYNPLAMHRPDKEFRPAAVMPV
jgi:hypothetical protein